MSLLKLEMLLNQRIQAVTLQLSRLLSSGEAPKGFEKFFGKKGETKKQASEQPSSVKESAESESVSKGIELGCSFLVVVLREEQPSARSIAEI